MCKKYLSLYLSAVLFIVSLFSTGYSLAENKGELHLYLGIPMGGATPKIVSQILLDEKEVSFETSKVVWSGNAYGIKDFGYEWNLQLDFEEDYTDVNRILLSSAQSARMDPEVFRERMQSDLRQFIDVEGQLTTLYGEPDSRFFYATNEQNGKSEKVMFQSGMWEIGQMMSICEKDLWFQSFSIWGNVVLQTWVDWKKPNATGEYLSRVMLYYYPDMQTTSAMIASSITPYPSTDDD
jgi:hypothetical protein